MRAPEPLILTADSAHLAAVGRVANEWSVLEAIVDMEIWRLAGLDPDAGVCITSQFMSVSRRMYALIALIHLKEGDRAADLVKAINKLSRRLDELARRRNRTVHDVWTYAPGSRQHYRREAIAERVLSFAFRAETKEDLTTLAEEIAAERRKFTGALREYEAAKPKSGKRWVSKASRETPA